MKNVLIIGSDFVPSSLPPSLRIRFFAAHLGEFGWNPTILTTDPSFYESRIDPENEALLPAGLEVIRTSAIPAEKGRRFGIGCVGMRSMWQHWRRAVDLCRERRFDVVFIPVPPYMPMALGRLLHIQFGIPYVIDYIDPWITEYYWSLPRSQRPPKFALAYYQARLVEPFAVRRASGITGVSQGTVDGVVEHYSWLRKAFTAAIPYGGEPADFKYLRHHPRPQRLFDPNDGLEHFVYVGACIRPMFPTVRALFAAIRKGLDTDPGLFSRLRLHFVGTSYDPNTTDRVSTPLAEEAGISHLVSEHPPRLPFLEALQVLLDSRSILVLGSDAPHYTASKVFPGILAKRPLLAIFHQASSVVDILNRTRAGDLVTYGADNPPETHVDEIVEALARILRLPRNYEPPTEWEEFERYTTRATTRDLAAVFDAAASPNAPRVVQHA